jgi:hypothetical protein
MVGLGMFLLVTTAVSAQQSEVNPQKLLAWMRTVNTIEVTYQTSNNHFADAQELLTAFPRELAAVTIQPYVLRVVTSAKGDHYMAAIRFPSEMHHESTWCKTEVFSDETGLISLGHNIECSGAEALGASSDVQAASRK